jgi:hypothetical protein
MPGRMTRAAGWHAREDDMGGNGARRAAQAVPVAASKTEHPAPRGWRVLVAPLHLGQIRRGGVCAHHTVRDDHGGHNQGQDQQRDEPADVSLCHVVCSFCCILVSSFCRNNLSLMRWLVRACVVGPLALKGMNVSTSLVIFVCSRAIYRAESACGAVPLRD